MPLWGNARRRTPPPDVSLPHRGLPERPRGVVRLTIPEVQRLEWECEGLRLAARLQSARSRDAPCGLLLHGGGDSHSGRTTWLAEGLARAGLSTLALDFSGHGGSDGELLGSSLRRRWHEARSSLRFFPQEGPTLLCGSSMGADTAVRLLGILPRVRALVLFCPALYDEAAFGAPFGPAFRAAIRRPDSWRRTAFPRRIAAFAGRLLVFTGAEDEVIPPGVPAFLEGHSPERCRPRVVHFPGCPHRIHEWLADREPERTRILEAILGDLGENPSAGP